MSVTVREMNTLKEAIMGSGENTQLIGSSPVVGTKYLATFYAVAKLSSNTLECAGFSSGSAAAGAFSKTLIGS